MDIKPIPTHYKGYLFRSRLEARWAVFFDACGVEWEYEPEGFDLGNGEKYLPDFLLHGVVGRAEGDLYVEVKGKMTAKDAEKINRFVALGKEDPEDPETFNKSKTATLVVGGIPCGSDINDIRESIQRNAYYTSPIEEKWWPRPYNFQSIDGDYFAAHPGINHEGQFELFGDANSYLIDMDNVLTEKAYHTARQARFEHGETPNIDKNKSIVTSCNKNIWIKTDDRLINSKYITGIDIRPEDNLLVVHMVDGRQIIVSNSDKLKKQLVEAGIPLY